MKLDSTEALLAEAEKELKREKAKGGILKKILKFFLFVFVIHYLIWLYLLYYAVSSGGHVQIGDVFGGILWAAMLSLLVIGWCYTFFLLIDSEKWYYQLFAVIMTGLFGAAILLGLRYIYRKLCFTFLD